MGHPAFVGNGRRARVRLWFPTLAREKSARMGHPAFVGNGRRARVRLWFPTLAPERSARMGHPAFVGNGRRARVRLWFPRPSGIQAVKDQALRWWGLVARIPPGLKPRAASRALAKQPGPEIAAFHRCNSFLLEMQSQGWGAGPKIRRVRDRSGRGKHPILRQDRKYPGGAKTCLKARQRPQGHP